MTEKKPAPVPPANRDEHAPAGGKPRRTDAGAPTERGAKDRAENRAKDAERENIRRNTTNQDPRQAR